jgi:uncharacterized protein YbjT (DUF2867 family)
MTIVVTGATGTVGRGIVNELVEAGHQVRAVTRDPQRASFPAGVEVVRGDLAEPESLKGAFDDAEALHLITFVGTGFGPAPLEHGQEIVDMAVNAGVKRITVLRGIDSEPVEAAVRDSGVAWTVLVPVEFMSNALNWAAPIKATGSVREPFADRLSAMVHEADIAAVAAVALAEHGHGGQTYVITGPEVLTLADKLAAIGAAIGREVELVALTEEQARAEWAQAGLPPHVIEFLVDVLGNTPEIGRTVASTVEEVTGRPGRTFAQWAREHADAFRA